MQNIQIFLLCKDVTISNPICIRLSCRAPVIFRALRLCIRCELLVFASFLARHATHTHLHI